MPVRKGLSLYRPHFRMVRVEAVHEPAAPIHNASALLQGPGDPRPRPEIVSGKVMDPRIDQEYHRSFHRLFASELFF